MRPLPAGRVLQLLRSPAAAGLSNLSQMALWLLLLEVGVDEEGRVNGQVWNERLRAECHFSRGQLKAARAELVESGLLEIVDPLAQRYRVVVPGVVWPPRSRLL